MILKSVTGFRGFGIFRYLDRLATDLQIKAGLHKA
jgi:hypothetical protein